MKKTFLFLSLLSTTLLFAQRTKVISLDYNISDFNVKLDGDKNTVINSNKYTIHFRQSEQAPALPCLGMNVLIGSDEELENYDVSFSEVKIGGIVQMRSNPVAVHGSEIGECKILKQAVYKNTIYPDTIVKYIGTCCRDGYRYLVFNVCPFAYIPQNHSLFFRHHIEIQIQLTPSAPSVKYGPYVGTNMRDVVRRLVVNSEELDTLYPRSVQSATRNMNTVVPSIASSDDYEYLIITSNALQSHFQRLADWKTRKGVRTKVITSEYIYSNYAVPSQYYVSNTYLQKVYKIKAAIQDYYENHGIKYVLLGGRGGNVPFFKSNDISVGSDWFYACLLGGLWNWGYNPNTYNANLTGIQDVTPDVYVTRALVVDTTEARIFVNRVIDYESGTAPDEWDYRALFWGSKIHYNYQLGPNLIKSDSQLFGDWILQSSFTNVYDCDRLYDTYSNLGYALTLNNLKTTLDDGYEFIHFSNLMNGQGNLRITNNEYYTESDAQAMTNQHYTLMTSATEYMVDLQNQSFANRFMNNPNNNVIAFLASNEYAYHSSDSSQILHIDLYMKEFYDILFDREICHFGEIAAVAKNVFEPDEYGQFNDTYLIVNLNAIGDCEMPIFLPYTYVFGDGTGPMSDRVTITYTNGILHVDTPDDCRICVMSKADKGATYYAVIDSVSGADFAPPLVECTVCVTNPYYKPFVKTIFSPVYVQNETITGNREIAGSQVSIGYDVTTDKPYGPVTISSGTTNVHTKNAIIKNRFTVNTGAKFIITNN